MTATVIEVFADVSCPFTHVGLRRLVTRRSQLGRGDVVFRIRAWPLELVNGAPLDPAMVSHKVAELRRQVAPDLFADFDAERFPLTSLPALALAGVADGEGSQVGERMGLLLRDALFEHGADLTSPSTLDQLAQQVGVRPATPADEEKVIADWQEGQDRGVIGSPHFFLGDADWFCPSLKVATVGDELRLALDVDAFEEFTRVCFGR